VASLRQRALYEPSSAMKGAAEPLVTIVEYSDFQCPFCGRFADTLDELVAAYPEDVRIVFMQFPLPMHIHAKAAAKAAIAAQAQGKFWAMHDRLFDYSGKLGPEALEEHARAVGLEMAAFQAAMEAQETEDRLLLEKTVGARMGVRGTPHFFVNGISFSGAVDPAKLQEIIDRERTHAQSLMAAGVPRREIYARIMRAARPAGAPESTAFQAKAAEPKAGEAVTAGELEAAGAEADGEGEAAGEPKAGGPEAEPRADDPEAAVPEAGEPKIEGVGAGEGAAAPSP